MAYKVFLIKRDINDATRVYIDIIKDAVKAKWKVSSIDEVYSVSDVKPDDILIIISLQALLKLIFRFKRNKFIFWFQGILPEEIRLAFPGIYSWFKVPVFTLAERFVLKHADLILMVSNAMLSHYQQKYGYAKSNYLIMPCFNQDLDEKCFILEKYQSPSFVYAGSILKWQCIEETIVLFAQIKKQLPEASLTILTADQSEAKKLIEKYQIEAVIKYVSMSHLKEELSRYKYGFLLREDHLVNRVATPTKMNSYLAAGIIPVFSDVIEDFHTVFAPLSVSVSGKVDNPFQIIQKIKNIENSKLDVQQIKNEYKELFSFYYDRGKYVRGISEKIPF